MQHNLGDLRLCSMKKFLLLIVFGLLSIIGKADHIIGSDITYTCVKDSIFKVIVNFYRDCNGCYVLGQSPRCGTNEDCNSSQTAPTSLKVTSPGSCTIPNLTMTRTGIKDITPVCSSEKSRCAQPCGGSYPYGIEKHTFEGTLDLRTAMKAGCCNFKVSVDLYVRSAIITTGQQQQSFSTFIEMDACRATCNNSPQLTNDPVAIACCNQPFRFNNGATDILDGDSISYELAPAYQIGGNATSYNSGLSATYPVPVYCNFGVPAPCTAIPQAKPPVGFFLDPINGDIVFTPAGSCPWVGVIVVQMNEWRKDSNGVYQKIGVTRRDMQVIAKNCGANNPPTLDSNFQLTVCANSTICETYYTNDIRVVPPPPAIAPPPDTVTLSWNKGIPGATFKIVDTSARLQRAQFCWTPTDDRVSNLPYTFTITAKDNNCPDNGRSVRGVSVTVKPRPFADRFYQILPCGKLVIHAEDDHAYADSAKADKKYYDKRTHPNAPSISYIWTGFDSTRMGAPLFSSGSQTDTIKFEDGGKKLIELLMISKNGCTVLYIDTVIIPPVLKVRLALNDTFVCENDSIFFNPMVLNGYPSFNYQWGVPHVVSNKDSFPYFSISPTTDTSVSLSVFDSEGCSSHDTVFIHFQKLSIPYIGPDERICTYDTFQIVVPYDSMLTYRWNDGPIGVDTTLTVNVAGQYWLHTIDSLGCFGRDTFELFVNDTVIAYAGPDATICRKETHTLEGGIEQDLSKTHVWNWYDLTTNTLVFNDKVNDVSPSDSTYYRLHLMITDGGQMCEDDDTMFLRVNQLPDLSTVRDPSPKCFDDGQFDLGAEYPIGANFKWSEKANSNVWYTMQDSRRDTMVRKGFATPNWFYTQRFFDADKNQGYVPDPNFDKVLIHVKHNPTGCEDSVVFNSRINPNPTVVLQDVTRCQDGGSFRVNQFLLRAPQNPDAGIYTWEIDSAPTGLTQFELGQILEDKNPSPFFSDYVFNPMIPGTNTKDPPNPKRLGTYKLMFCYEDGATNCRTCDSVYVTVEELPKIEFTPFDKFCYSDDTINLDDYVNLPQGRWELINFNGNLPPSPAYNYAVGRMLDSTQINVLDVTTDDFNPEGQGGTYFWRYVNVTTGCPVKDSVEMIVSARPQLAVIDLDTICIDAGLVDLAALVTTPNAGIFNAGGPLTGWSGNGVTGSTFDPAAVVTANVTDPLYGPFVQTVVYQHPNTLCVNNDSVDVMIQVAPVINITTPLPAEACEGLDFNLTATAERAGAGISWTTAGDGTFDDNASLTPVYTPGTADDLAYGTTLTITSNQPDYLRHCPAATADINLNIHAYPDFDFGDFDSGCTPVTANFSVDPLRRPTNYPVTYLWDFGNGQTSTDSAPQNIIFTGEGTYNVSVTVTNTAGACATTKEDTFIRVFPIPVASFTSNPDYYTTVALPRFQFTNTSSISNGSIDSFLWDFDDLGARYTAPDDISNLENPSFAYADDTMQYNIRFTVVSDKGCVDDTVKNIKIGPDITVFIPTAFSPDGAGPNSNNNLLVVAQGYIDYNLKIFNRWGEKLFESKHPVDEQWDGTYQGEPVQQGVYVYYAEVIAFDGELYKYSGTVTLLR